LLIRRRAWNQLAAWAEQLTAETLAAEAELLGKVKLMDELGLPRALCSVLKSDRELTPAAVRTMRFDFHLTTEGWRISEVNSDVPGGFSESSYFTAQMAAHCPDGQPAGDPAACWADAIARVAGSGGLVAMLAAPGYMEDQQIMAFLAARLRERGCVPCLANPAQVTWLEGHAHLDLIACGAAAALVRFYQGEWLARLPARLGWEHFIRGGRTPVTNPGVAVLSESKRLPLVWDRLNTAVSLWRELLPETRAPGDAPWTRDEAWLVKSALSNTGDDVGMRDLLKPQQWRALRWAVRFQPGRWLAQRRFESVAVTTPDGARHACIGVYTIDGRAAGAYARLSEKPLINYSAMDAALLVEEDGE
jgi:glutathionylspermidine synthase